MSYKIRIFPYYHLKEKRAEVDYLTSHPNYTPDQFFEKKFLVIPNGRYGINALLKKFQLSPKDEVYISTSSESMYVTSCVTCSIFNHCKPSRVLSNRTKVIFIIHEFGVPNKKTEHLVEYARDENLIVIEDCAHTFDSKINNKMVGTFGDYAIYSLTKIFPMSRGGLIVGDDLEIPKLNGYNFQNLKFIYREFTKFFPLLPEFSKRRKENFKYLLNKFNEISLKSFFAIKEDFTPYFFPLKLQNNFFQIFNEINKRGVECAVWHGENVILLPIHPLLDKKDLDYILETIKELLREERLL